jgi:uncharacterized protein
MASAHVDRTAASATIDAKNSCESENRELVQINGIAPLVHWVPSHYNARARSDDGTFLLYNSYTGAFSGFPVELSSDVERILHREGISARREGLVKYMADRGYIVPQGTNEFQRLRMQYGTYQYRNDVLELILLPSEECNFRCVYCYESFPRGTMEKWVRQAVINLARQRMPLVRAFKISWFGGEPLLGFEAIQEIAPACLELANQNGVRFASSITTNAYLLTPEIFRKLLDWKVSVYQITLDGAPEEHNKKRVLKGTAGPSFSTIYSNLKGMKDFADEFLVHIRINFDRENLSRLDDLMVMLKEDFAGDPRFDLNFYPISRWGGTNDDNLEVCGLSGSEEKRKLESRAIDYGLRPMSKLPAITPSSGSNVCYAARPYNLLIGADGKIMKCTIVLDTADYNIVGHLQPDGRVDIDLDKFARWVSPYYEDDRECRKCFYVPVCQGCSCPLIRIADNSRPCPDEKLNIKKTLNAEWRLRRESANQYNLSTGELAQSQSLFQK